MWSCVQLPASLLTSEQPVGVMPPLPIQPTVTLPLVLTLIRDSFQYEVGQDDNAESRALLASLVSLQHEPYGWNAIVQPRLRYHDLERPDRSVCHAAAWLDPATLRPRQPHCSASQPNLLQ